jgi:hypothetical protein
MCMFKFYWDASHIESIKEEIVEDGMKLYKIKLCFIFIVSISF